MEFIDGERHFTTPTPWEADLVARWIEEGALPSGEVPTMSSLEIPDVQFKEEGGFVFCHVRGGSAFVRVVVTGAQPRAERFVDWARTDGQQWSVWRIPSGTSFVGLNRIRLEIYPELDNVMYRTIFAASQTEPSDLLRDSIRMYYRFEKDPTMIPRDKSGTFVFKLDDDSDTKIEVRRLPGREPESLYQRELPDLGQGEQKIDWDLKTNAGNIIEPGAYGALVTASPRDGGSDQKVMFDFAIEAGAGEP
jgi:hypothetical protein